VAGKIPSKRSLDMHWIHPDTLRGRQTNKRWRRTERNSQTDIDRHKDRREGGRGVPVYSSRWRQ